MTHPFDLLTQYPRNEFLTIAGELVAVPVLGDLTVNEEIAGVELQSRWEPSDFANPVKAVEYRVEAVALFLSSRSGRSWSVEEVKNSFTSKTTKRVFALWQSEIQAAMTGLDEGESEGGKSEITGSASTGDSSFTTQATPDSVLTDSEATPSV